MDPKGPKYWCIQPRYWLFSQIENILVTGTSCDWGGMWSHAQHSPRRQAVAGPKMVIFDFSTLYSYLSSAIWAMAATDSSLSKLFMWLFGSQRHTMWLEKALLLLCNIKLPTLIEDGAPWNLRTTDLFAFCALFVGPHSHPITLPWADHVWTPWSAQAKCVAAS